MCVRIMLSVVVGFCFFFALYILPFLDAAIFCVKFCVVCFVCECVFFHSALYISLCVRAFSLPLLPFPSRILFPLHFNVHFYCNFCCCCCCVASVHSATIFFLCHFQLLLALSLASPYYRVHRSLWSVYLFFLDFYLDYRHVVWCSSLHFDYIYLTAKTVVHRMIFGWQCDGYWTMRSTQLNRTESNRITHPENDRERERERKKVLTHITTQQNTQICLILFVFPTAANQYQNYMKSYLIVVKRVLFLFALDISYILQFANHSVTLVQVPHILSERAIVSERTRTNWKFILRKKTLKHTKKNTAHRTLDGIKYKCSSWKFQIDCYC